MEGLRAWLLILDRSGPLEDRTWEEGEVDVYGPLQSSNGESSWRYVDLLCSQEKHHRYQQCRSWKRRGSKMASYLE